MYIEQGNYAIHACSACSVSNSSYYDWLRRGELDSVAGDDTIFSQFQHAIKEAEGKAVVFHMANIHAAAEAGKWEASMTWLERRFPDLFGKRIVEPIIENKILIQLRDTGKEMIAINTSEPKQLSEATVDASIPR
jgi:hypothetical protein